MDISTAITDLLVLSFFIFFFFSCILLRNTKHKRPPTAPGHMPIIGHLHLLAGATKLPHIALSELADKCGPIFSIRLGMHRAVVVNDWETAKECYTTHDAALTSRPKFAAAKYLAYNYAMFGFSSHVTYWRDMRKMATLEMLSARRMELLKHVRISEVEMSIKSLYQLWHDKKDASSGGCVSVDLEEWVGRLSLNIILRTVAGKRYDDDSGGGSDESEKCRWQKAVTEFFELLGRPVVSDAFPFLEWLDIGGHIKKMKRTARELDSILDKWLEEHRRKKVCPDDQKDFMDVMISTIDSKDLADYDVDTADYDVDTVIKSTCLAMVAGAAETTTITMVWAISLLLNNPHVLKKAKKELHEVIGSGRLQNETDINNLVYLQAIVKETLRLYPPAPLLAPREFTKDCIISGYHISKGTRLIPNVWKIQNDPQVWPDPSTFKPERFLTTHKDVDLKGQHFELLPFGSGRKGCPGTNFGLKIIHLALASFLHAFEVSTPENAKVDMTGSVGQNNTKATPLQVLVRPRIDIPF